MIASFTPEEGSILIRLLIAHCLTDFYLQPRLWVEHKNEKILKSEYLWYHGILTGLIAWLLLWTLNSWWIAVIILLTHLAIDAGKIRIEKKRSNKPYNEFTLFVSDQLLHILVIVVLWLFYINGWNKMALFSQAYFPDFRILLRILGYLLMAWPAGFFIQFLIKRWLAELNLEDSLTDAGKWIGILERVLIITLIYSNAFAAIGFLIAAKSLLRVTDKPERTNTEAGVDKPFSTRKHTEYVLIGTFLSFTIAIITGLIINRILNR